MTTNDLMPLNDDFFPSLLFLIWNQIFFLFLQGKQGIAKGAV